MAGILADHWAQQGRNYYLRHDCEAVPTDAANDLPVHVIGQLEALPGKYFAGLAVSRDDEFSYRDPIDSSVSDHQGLRIWFEGGGRVVLRLSGTGTEGATILVYLQQYRSEKDDMCMNSHAALLPLKLAVTELARIRHFLGRIEPDFVT